MTIPVLTVAPTAPNRATDTPDVYPTRADAYVTWLEGFAPQLNTWATEVALVVSGLDFNGTSTTSLLIGTGSKVFTTQSGKLWQVGQFVIAANTPTPANYMYGQVTAYSGTSLTVNVTTIGGSGTLAAWSIGLSPNSSAYATQAGAETLTNKTVNLTSNTLSGTRAQFNTAMSDDDFASLAGTETLSAKTLANPTITGSVIEATYAITDAAGVAVDPRNGSIQSWTLAASRTPTLGTWNNGDAMLLQVTAAGFSVTWTTMAVTWIGGVAPTLAASGASAIRLWKLAGVIYGERNIATPSLDITYVGGITATGITSGAGATNPTVSLTALTGGIGSTALDSDFVICTLSVASVSDLALTMNTAGFTILRDDYANGTNDANLGVFYKRMTSTPDASLSPSITVNGLGSYAIAVQVWRNVHATTPLDVTTTTANSITTVLANPPAATAPVTGNVVVIACAAGAHAGGVQTFTATGLVNSLTAGADGTSYDATVGMGAFNNPVGAYDPAAWTFSTTDSANYTNCSATLVLRRA